MHFDPGSRRTAASAKRPYVLVTPAHNEAEHVARCIDSVARQTLLPQRWVIVDDASTDGTSEIARLAAEPHDFITVLRRQRPPGRHFANKVRAFEAGLGYVRDIDYAFVGNLDADMTLPASYYADAMGAFEADLRLGIVGGMVSSQVDGRFVSQNVALDSVAGAVQFFRRECYEAIGGYRALPLGGIDAAAEIAARMHGWKTRTEPSWTVLEHRRTGSAASLPLEAKVREGRRLRALGYRFSFLSLRAVKRSMERPRVLGSLATLAGFVQSALRREPLALPPELVRFLRAEQRRKLTAWMPRPARPDLQVRGD